MKPRIVVRPDADRDMDGHFHYLSRSSPNTATRFLHAAEATFDQLAGMPQLGALGEYGLSRLSGIRVWRVKGFENHLIFYRPIEHGIEVVRVLHGAQDIEALLDDQP